jgi:predicted transcriptional regulator
MAQAPTEDEVVEAARSLGREEFTRDDVAEKLGVEISELQPSWKAAKDAGRIQKSRNEGGKRYLRLAD